MPQEISLSLSVPRRRWRIAFLLALGVLVNFFDRINLSVSRDALHDSFGLSLVAFGYLSSAFSWTYAFMQMPCGVLLDRWGVRRVGRISALLVEHFFIRRCSCSRPRVVLRGALPSRRERIADVSRERQGFGLLVYARRAKSGDGDHRRRGEILQRHRSAVDRPAAPVFWLALELRRHRLDQLYLFPPVLRDLPQSQRRQRTVSATNSIHSARWRSTGRSGKSAEVAASLGLSSQPAQSLRAGAGMGRLQLHFFSAAHVAAQLSFRFAACGFVSLDFLHQRAVAVCHVHRIS